jgi:hypothetical protein
VPASQAAEKKGGKSTRAKVAKPATPKPPPSARAIRMRFKKERNGMVSEFFELVNSAVFSGQLPEDLDISWSNKLRKTAGVTLLTTCVLLIFFFELSWPRSALC